MFNNRQTFENFPEVFIGRSAKPLPETMVQAKAPRSTFAEPIVRCWQAYHRWREQRIATAYLSSCNDRLLEDLGIARCEIDEVVKGRHTFLERRYDQV